MSLDQTIRKAAFLGLKYEPNDIVDYIEIQGLLLASVLMGTVLAIWVGSAVGPLAGVMVGTGSYAASMRIGGHIFFPNRGQR